VLAFLAKFIRALSNSRKKMLQAQARNSRVPDPSLKQDFHSRKRSRKGKYWFKAKREIMKWRRNCVWLLL